MTANYFFPPQVGDSSAHFYYTVVRAGRESRFFHCHFQQIVAGSIDRAEFFQFFTPHTGIAEDPRSPLKQFQFIFSGSNDAFSDLP
jgi:hypothetical protein